MGEGKGDMWVKECKLPVSSGDLIYRIVFINNYTICMKVAKVVDLRHSHHQKKKKGYYVIRQRC